MRNIKLLTGVAVIALFAGASGAYAGGPKDVTNVKMKGDVEQETINKADVKNKGAIIIKKVEGTGASVSIGASGAVSSVSASSITDTPSLTSVKVAGNITQTTKNTGSLVKNKGLVLVKKLDGAGTSASVSALGAASAVSLSSIK
jgi:threonine dehydrogenase-like Zn-dependent dehydrogenase